MKEEASELGMNILLAPEKIWAWAQEPDTKIRLKSEMVLIAESECTGYEIYVSIDSKLVTLYVYDDDKMEYSEAVVSAEDCKSTANRLFSKYLMLNETKHEGTLLDADMYDEIDMREDELMFAFLDFLSVACDCDMIAAFDAGYAEDVRDAFEDILARLAHEHGFLVYRPTFITDDETGDEMYIEYPYSDEESSDGLLPV